MEIKRFVNKIFNSNTFLLTKKEEENVWIVDPGDSSSLISDWIKNENRNLAGVLLTHAHFDHMYGLNHLIELFPSAEIYASPFAKEIMTSPKLNGSLYQEIPFTIHKSAYNFIGEGDTISLWNEKTLFVYETPGHSPDSISFFAEDNLFTGDALIPGIKVFTKLKNGNKLQAENSINKIVTLFGPDTMIWPGHEENCLLRSLVSDEQLNKNHSAAKEVTF